VHPQPRVFTTELGDIDGKERERAYLREREREHEQDREEVLWVYVDMCLC